MCECCEEIEWCKESFGHLKELKARIVAVSSSSEIGCKKVELNYCPECGKKLKDKDLA